MKHIFKILKQIVIIILWSLFLFLQHVTCFDVFDSNAWYLYILAVLFAFAHCFSLFPFFKLLSRKSCLWFFGFIYAFLSLMKLYQIFYWKNYHPYHIGLTVICLILDVLGMVIVGTMALKAKKKKTGDGSLS